MVRRWFLNVFGAQLRKSKYYARRVSSAGRFAFACCAEDVCLYGMTSQSLEGWAMDIAFIAFLQHLCDGAGLHAACPVLLSSMF